MATDKRDLTHMRFLFVVDLDETLIDRKFKPYLGAFNFLKKLQKMNFFVFLWTAGNEKHVNYFFNTYPEMRSVIDSYKCGLIRETKPANVAELTILKSHRIEFEKTILLDDNLNHIKKGKYDYAFFVLDYCNKPMSSKPNFNHIYSEIKKIHQLYK